MKENSDRLKLNTCKTWHYDDASESNQTWIIWKNNCAQMTSMMKLMTFAVYYINANEIDVIWNKYRPRFTISIVCQWIFVWNVFCSCVCFLLTLSIQIIFFPVKSSTLQDSFAFYNNKICEFLFKRVEMCFLYKVGWFWSCFCLCAPQHEMTTPIIIHLFSVSFDNINVKL